MTNGGYSDWATQDVPGTMTAAAWRVRRSGSDFFIDWRPLDAAEWQQLRVAPLIQAGAGAEVLVGAYACAPQGPGFMARFRELTLERP